MGDPVSDVLGAIEMCNQRGGRMLSVIDLLKRGTIDLDAAAHVAARVHRGASFLVGAVPGGAGKTTVMGAFLCLLHPRMRIVACDGPRAIESARSFPVPCCALAHEISPGPYYCYLWGEDIRAYFSLRRKGHMLVTNLHADTIEQAREQVCGENGVSPADFEAIDVFIFLSAHRAGGRRRIEVREILVRDPETARHVTLRAPFHRTEDTGVKRWRVFLETLLRRDVFLLEEVRTRVTAFSGGDAAGTRSVAFRQNYHKKS